MTDKTMTLEQVRNILEQAKEVCFKLEDGSRVYCGGMADTITRHLSQPAERGEVVAWRCKNGHKEWAGECPYCADNVPEKHYTAPLPAAVVPDALLRLITLWRRVEYSNEEETEFDKGYEQASNECADSLEAALSATPSPTIDVAGVPDASEVLSEYVRICIDEHTDRAGSEHRVEAMARAITKAMLSAAPEADH